MNPVYGYDFRYSADSVELDQILEDLKEISKKYVFQLEEGDSGYKHYQGRLSLIKKRRKHEALRLFSHPPNYFEPTNTSEYLTGEAFYQTKKDTRILGPWSDQDKELYIPRQIREIENLYPFQQQIVDSVCGWDKRSINLVYDPNGCNGKSILVGYLRAHALARCLPPLNDSKDMLRMVCDLPTSRCYIIDMPRCMNKDRLFGFYSAIETIKDGYAYDDRYSFREKVFDCPNIWIFSNSIPDLKFMSFDRWKIWGIDQKTKDLFNYNIADRYKIID